MRSADMSVVVGCLAAALLAWPQAGVRRRCLAVLGDLDRPRKILWRSIFRVGLGIGVAASAVLGPGVLVAVLLMVVTVGVRVRRARAVRLRAVECGALLEGLETVIGELRVGAHPSAAAAVASGEIEGIAARAFAMSSARSRLGGSAAAGLRAPGTIISAELSRIADAWQVADRHGLALAELLTAARADLLGRIRFRERTAAALAGARASAVVLSTLPLLGLALGQLMGAAPLHVLLSRGAGAVLLPVGTALISLGLLWTDAITAPVSS
ncbi:tight adherence protein B [Nocardia sp. GAS34]